MPESNPIKKLNGRPALLGIQPTRNIACRLKISAAAPSWPAQQPYQHLHCRLLHLHRLSLIPIFAAIAAHRTANLEYHDDENIVDEDHPQYENQMRRLYDATKAAAVNLRDVRPTTMAGTIALLNYYAEATVSHDATGEDWPELEDKQDGIEKPFDYFLTRNVARALGNISVAGEAVQS
jgi:hypothetical protein